MIIPRTIKSRFGTGTDAIRRPGLASLVEVDADPDIRGAVAQISSADTDYNINDHLSSTYPVVATPSGANVVISLDDGYQALQFYLSQL